MELTPYYTHVNNLYCSIKFGYVPGRARAGGADHTDLSHMDLGDPTLVLVDKAEVALVSGGLGVGVVPGFKGPLFWGNPECSLHTRFSDTSTPPPPIHSTIGVLDTGQKFELIQFNHTGGSDRFYN